MTAFDYWAYLGISGGFKGDSTISITSAEICESSISDIKDAAFYDKSNNIVKSNSFTAGQEFRFRLRFQNYDGNKMPHFQNVDTAYNYKIEVNADCGIKQKMLLDSTDPNNYLIFTVNNF